MKKNVLFIGDSCVDWHFEGSYDRVSPENPDINIFKVSAGSQSNGMVFNTYMNFKNIISHHKSPISSELMTNNEYSRPIKSRFYHNDKMIFRYDAVDKIVFDTFNIDYLNLLNVDFVVVSDYNKGYLNDEDIEEIGQSCDSLNIPCLIDTKRLIKDFHRYYTFIKLNQDEYNNNLTNNPETQNYENIILTQGALGCTINKEQLSVPYKQPEKVYPEGCGDTFVAGFVYSYLSSKSPKRAAKFGMKMAGKVIGKKGVTVPF